MALRSLHSALATALLTLISLPLANHRVEASDFALRADPSIPKNIVRDARRVLALTQQQLGDAFPDLAKAEAASVKQVCTVRLYRSPTAFRSAVSKRTRGRFDHSFAFADYAAATGHVALQPYLSDEALAIVGVPVLTRYQIAHEATHLWLAMRAREYLDADDWIREGLATWIAGKVVTTGGWISSFEADPFAATRLRRVQRLYLGRTRTFTPCDASWYDALGSPDRYALAWCWTRFLIEAANIKPQELWSRAARAKFESSALRSQFKDDCLAHRFAWYETGRALQWHDGVGYQCAFDESAATAWRAGQRWPMGEALSGTLTILANPGNEARVLLAKAADGHVVVSFQPKGGVQLLWQRSAYEPATVLARSNDVRLKQGQPYDFQIRYRRGEVSVSIDNQRVLRAPLNAKQPGDGWGLGAGAGVAVRWSNIRLTAAGRP